jgi:ribosomal protein L17
MANPRGQQRDKPFRDALRMAIAETNGDFKKLRKVAEALVEKAETGDVNAIREIADRLDGKVPQAIVGDDEYPAVTVTWQPPSSS